MSIEITLTADELTIGSFLGATRRVRHMVNPSDQKVHYSEHDEWNSEINSALAEVAVSRAFDRSWTGAVSDGKTFHPFDVGVLGVRWVTRPSDHLLVYERDPDDQILVLVTSTACSPVFTIIGHMLAKAGKEKGEWRVPPAVKRASWWVDQKHLIKFTEDQNRWSSFERWLRGGDR